VRFSGYETCDLREHPRGRRDVDRLVAGADADLEGPAFLDNANRFVPVPDIDKDAVGALREAL
jgi:hypothetical protein